MAKLVIVPGLCGSGESHWQTRWQCLFPESLRVTQRDFDHPDRDEWVSETLRVVREAGEPVLLVAHSLGCAVVAHGAARFAEAGVVGAFLVAPADVDSELHTPPEVRGFAPMPLSKLPFESLVLTSTNDPYITLDRAKFMAQKWGSRFASVGAAGHINADSDLGDWPDGQTWLDELAKHAKCTE